jgi:3-hydroxyisobutyrate dehydrogenase
MGAPMAARLLGAGHDLTVYNRTPAKAEPLITAGAKLAGSPAEAVADAEIAITMVSGPDALESVTLAPGGLVGALQPGATWVDMSTVGPDAMLSVAGKLADGRFAVDAPVLGSVPQAKTGSLEIFVGGEPSSYESLFPLLSTMGRPRLVGPLGSAAALKLVVNSALVALQCVLGECLALADGFSLDQTTVLDALELSSLGPVVAKKRAMIESGSFAANFTVANASKDAALVGEAADRRGVPMPIARAAMQWFEAALNAGMAEEDYAAVVKAIMLARRA